MTDPCDSIRQRIESARQKMNALEPRWTAHELAQNVGLADYEETFCKEKIRENFNGLDSIYNAANKGAWPAECRQYLQAQRRNGVHQRRRGDLQDEIKQLNDILAKCREWGICDILHEPR